LRRERIFERDRFRCVYCGECFPAEALTVDHVEPRARGGDRSGGNLVTACGPCNTAKGHRRLSEYLLESADARRKFAEHALPHLWPRLRRALEDELLRAGVSLE
jgi:5-methylcytosine-specific restriction endonuclease McrA